LGRLCEAPTGPWRPGRRILGHRIRPNCNRTNPNATACRAATRLIPNTECVCNDAVQPESSRVCAPCKGRRQTGGPIRDVCWCTPQRSCSHDDSHARPTLLEPPKSPAVGPTPPRRDSADASHQRQCARRPRSAANDLTVAVQQQMALRQAIAAQKKQLTTIAAQQVQLTGPNGHRAGRNLDQVSQNIDDLQGEIDGLAGSGRCGPRELQRPGRPGRTSSNRSSTISRPRNRSNRLS